MIILVKMIIMSNKSITATEAKNRFADLVDQARTEPITITRNDRAVAIVLSPTEYARLTVSDDAYWGEQAKKISTDDFHSAEESQAFLNTILNASDKAS
jgi:prevent-host-death family protein